MKKKWITLKRLWRKLDGADRWFLGAQAVLAMLNLGVCFISPGSIVNFLWIGLITFNYLMAIERVRRARYRWFRLGDLRQFLLSNRKYAKLAGEYADCARELKETHSAYCKLQYDYNKLKKEVRKKK